MFKRVPADPLRGEGKRALVKAFSHLGQRVKD